MTDSVNAYRPLSTENMCLQAQDVRQRQQARETKLEKEGTTPVEKLSPSEANSINSYYNKVSEHIDQVRYPKAIQALDTQPYVKDGSDPQLLSVLQEALEKAPELQGTQLAASVKSGRVSAEDIQTVQKFLESKGYSVGSAGIDGKYGPCTNKALQGFLGGNKPEASDTAGPSSRAAGTAGAGTDRASGQAGAQQVSHGGANTGAPAAGQGAAATSTQPQGRNSGQTTGAPAGYKAITGQVPAGVSAKAKSLLGGEFGNETPFEIDGKKYMARVEHHYHPPGYVGGPTGWHKGVTVYQQA